MKRTDCACSTNPRTYRVVAPDGYVRPEVKMCAACAAYVARRGYEVTEQRPSPESAAATCGYPHAHTNGYCTLARYKNGWPIPATRMMSYLKRYRPELYANLRERRAN